MTTAHTPTDVAEAHYCDLNGRISCTGHIGAAATAYLMAEPKAKVVETSLTVWVRLTAREKFDLVKEMDTKTLCETCRRGI